jgi:hypothetical protein
MTIALRSWVSRSGKLGRFCVQSTPKVGMFGKEARGQAAFQRPPAVVVEVLRSAL